MTKAIPRLRDELNIQHERQKVEGEYHSKTKLPMQLEKRRKAKESKTKRSNKAQLAPTR